MPAHRQDDRSVRWPDIFIALRSGERIRFGTWLNNCGKRLASKWTALAWGSKRSPSRRLPIRPAIRSSAGRL